MSLSSHAGDSAIELCWRWHCHDDLAIARCRCQVMLVTVLLSHADDGTVETAWPRRDVVAESC
jgi:hypothetical protein